MVQLNHNSYDYDPIGDFQPVPEGMYHVMIVNSEIKPTKDGNGSYAEFQLKIQGGDMDGRILFERLNLWNQNETAVDIANRTLSAICTVCNVAQISDTTQLHGIPFQVYVTIQPAKGDYGPSNNLKGYYDVNGVKASDIRKAAPGGPGQGYGGNAQQPPAPPQGGGYQQPPQQPQQYQQPPVQPQQQNQPPQAPPQQVVHHQQQPPQAAPGYQGPQGEQYQNPTNANGQTQPSQPQNAAQGAPQGAGTSAPGATAAPGSGQAQQGSPTPTAQPAAGAQPAAPQGQPGGNAPWQN